MRWLRRPKIWSLLLQSCVPLKECRWIIHTKISVSSSHSKSLSKHYAVRNKKEQQNKPLCDSNIPKWSLKHPPLGHKTAFFNSVCCTMKHEVIFSTSLMNRDWNFLQGLLFLSPISPPFKNNSQSASTRGFTVWEFPPHDTYSLGGDLVAPAESAEAFASLPGSNLISSSCHPAWYHLATARG